VFSSALDELPTTRALLTKKTASRVLKQRLIVWVA
jgi:hypothetical protein